MDEAIAGEGQLSLWGDRWWVYVEMTDLGLCKTSRPAVCERAIKEGGGGGLVVHTDGSRDDDGRVGGRWHTKGNGLGVLRLVTSLLYWMGRWQGYVKHSEWLQKLTY